MSLVSLTLLEPSNPRNLGGSMANLRILGLWKPHQEDALYDDNVVFWERIMFLKVLEPNEHIKPIEIIIITRRQWKL